MRPVVLILLGLSCGAIGLKCRSQEGATDAELKRIVRSCMQRSSSSSNTGGNNQDQDDERYYGNQRYNFDSSYNGQDYGQERGQGQGQGQRQQQSYDNRWRRSSKQSDSNNNNKGNNTSEMGPCVAQCFFEEMNMVDASGQPERRKVTYLLTKDIRDRELRNFYMDTVQQCFRYLEHSRYNSNKCSQSRELIKCMSEYAKAQCDDWEEYQNLLFN